LPGGVVIFDAALVGAGGQVVAKSGTAGGRVGDNIKSNSFVNTFLSQIVQ